jgi:MOSC domain-containing protein YiiM
MICVDAIEVVAGAGIVGDRTFGAEQRYPGQNITLIEIEAVQAFNARTGLKLRPTDPRRNIVTRDVRLNDLVGVEFRIGSAHLKGVELCEPCGTLADYLGGGVLSKRDFIREFLNRCGLRADVVKSGRIRLGDPFLFGKSVSEPGNSR